MPGTAFKFLEVPASADVETRARWWAQLVTTAIIEDEHISRQIPDDALLVILPEPDDEVRSYNVARAKGHDAKIVYVQIELKNRDHMLVTPYVAEQTRAFALA